MKRFFGLTTIMGVVMVLSFVAAIWYPDPDIQQRFGATGILCLFLLIPLILLTTWESDA